MTTGTEGHVRVLADELEALLGEQLTAEEFEARYRVQYQAGVVPHALLDLIASVAHYLSDADIRARDAEYRQMQEREMRRLIDALRAGRLEEAARISFLGPSRGTP